ncbi:MAG: DUF2306 domain-containing protein [Pseudomonadota bacterium]
MTETLKRIGPKITWPMIFFLIVLLIAFAAARTIDILTGTPGVELDYGPPMAFTDRYFDHPVLSIIHMVTGILFLVMAPLQFWPKFRAKNRTFHRWSGRVLVIAGLIAGVTGIMSGVMLPGFGGFSTLLGSWFFGVLFIICFLRSFWLAFNRQINLHREWIIRAFAIGLGVGTQRVLIIIVMPMDVATFEVMFAPLFWMGTAINMLIAECWINITRKRRA